MSAIAIAIVFGHFLSPHYPYWSVLSANMVLLGTETDGHTSGKAFQRMAGTVIGAIVGFVIGHFVAGQPYIAMLLLITSIFTGYYQWFNTKIAFALVEHRLFLYTKFYFLKEEG